MGSPSTNSRAPWEREPESGIVVIQLDPPEDLCHLCDKGCRVAQGVPIYEGEIVPDDHRGQWGGVNVCLRCFYLVRGIQEQHPGKLIPFWFVRKLLDDADRSE